MKSGPLKRYHQPKSCLQGFSLIEALISIAVIGVLTTIAIGFLSNHHKAAETSRDRRNAQNLAVVCTVAEYANLHFIVPGDPVQTCRNVVQGGIAPSGPAAGKAFGLPGMIEEDIVSAAWYLDVRDHELLYRGDRPPP